LPLPVIEPRPSCRSTSLYRSNYFCFSYNSVTLYDHRCV
jgi:hypothetical protein